MAKESLFSDRLIKLESTDSTNSYVRDNWDNLPKPALVYSVIQTDGRGQRGNRWESEPGKNLTCTFAFIPEGVRPSDQFNISVAVSLAVVDLLKTCGIEAKVKWPNDIYVGDLKIAGILIENVILGREISRCVAGVGLNVNQNVFLSDAPNPVSMFNITRQEYDITNLAESFFEKLNQRLNCGNSLQNDFFSNFENNLKEYKVLLWRKDEKYYPFFDRNNDERIVGRIKDVASDGLLTVETASGEDRTFAFKEIEFIL